VVTGTPAPAGFDEFVAEPAGAFAPGASAGLVGDADGVPVMRANASTTALKKKCKPLAWLPGVAVVVAGDGDALGDDVVVDVAGVVAGVVAGDAPLVLPLPALRDDPRNEPSARYTLL